MKSVFLVPVVCVSAAVGWVLGPDIQDVCGVSAISEGHAGEATNPESAEGNLTTSITDARRRLHEINDTIEKRECHIQSLFLEYFELVEALLNEYSERTMGRDPTTCPEECLRRREIESEVQKLVAEQIKDLGSAIAICDELQRILDSIPESRGE